MTDKCEHSTGTVVFTTPRLSIVKCDWGCGEHLIEIQVGNNTVKTFTVDEILSAAAELAELRARLEKAEQLLSAAVCRVDTWDNLPEIIEEFLKGDK